MIKKYSNHHSYSLLLLLLLVYSKLTQAIPTVHDDLFFSMGAKASALNFSTIAFEEIDNYFLQPATLNPYLKTGLSIYQFKQLESTHRGFIGKYGKRNTNYTLSYRTITVDNLQESILNSDTQTLIETETRYSYQQSEYRLGLSHTYFNTRLNMGACLIIRNKQLFNQQSSYASSIAIGSILEILEPTTLGLAIHHLSPQALRWPSGYKSKPPTTFCIGLKQVIWYQKLHVSCSYYTNTLNTIFVSGISSHLTKNIHLYLGHSNTTISSGISLILKKLSLDISYVKSLDSHNYYNDQPFKVTFTFKQQNIPSI
ncbi:MAG: hypothetical protein VW378_06295 [bacterium]